MMKAAMDLGCLDLGCISTLDKRSDLVLVSEIKEDEATGSSSMNSKSGKSKTSKETGQSPLNDLNRLTSQIKKPPHRKNSPLNWFPRKKVDSYLKRKIKLLQEVGGMNSTLDETLEDSNPHYSRVLREKIAAREAAHRAMEARKAALVEASWCRILRAARIQSKEAEALLLKAEKTAAEAFEAATAVGVIMYDIPNSPRKPCQIETSSANGGTSTTHTVTASFETAFEVDKEVAAAVKIAFSRLADCPSFNEDEIRDLLRKISQNPDTGDSNQELPEFSSECESEPGSELEMVSQKGDFSSQELDSNIPVVETRQKKHKRGESFEKFNKKKLGDIMLERLRGLQEDELSSLATIVATCGLNAALAEVGNSKLHNPDSVAADHPSAPFHRRMSSLVAGRTRNSGLEYFMDGQMGRKQVDSEIPSLDKFLVKHLSKLEREVQEAKNTRRNESREGGKKNSDTTEDGKVNLDNDITSSESIPDLGSIHMKHSSKFEKEIEEAKKNSGRTFEMHSKKSNSDMTLSDGVPDLGSILIKHSSKLEKEIEETKRNDGQKLELNSSKLGRTSNGVFSHNKDASEIPSLDKLLVKHVSRLEMEVQEARNKRKNDRIDGVVMPNLKKKVAQSEKNGSSCCDGLVRKENIDSSREVYTNSKMEHKDCTLNLSLPKPAECTSESLMANDEQVNRNGGEMPFLQDVKAGVLEEKQDGLDKILIKPVHRLERERMQALSSGSNDGFLRQQKRCGNNATECESLDKVLVKHVSRLEREKNRRSKEEIVNIKRCSINRHSQMNEEGSLDQILVKHTSKLEREKMAAAAQQPGEMRHSVARREAKEKELQEAWGGLSLGNSMRPHISKLERDKATWIKAEEEERRQAKV